MMTSRENDLYTTLLHTLVGILRSLLLFDCSRTVFSHIAENRLISVPCTTLPERKGLGSLREC